MKSPCTVNINIILFIRSPTLNTMLLCIKNQIRKQNTKTKTRGRFYLPLKNNVTTKFSAHWSLPCVKYLRKIYIFSKRFLILCLRTRAWMYACASVGVWMCACVIVRLNVECKCVCINNSSRVRVCVFICVC